MKLKKIKSLLMVNPTILLPLLSIACTDEKKQDDNKKPSEELLAKINENRETISQTVRNLQTSGVVNNELLTEWLTEMNDIANETDPNKQYALSVKLIDKLGPLLTKSTILDEVNKAREELINTFNKDKADLNAKIEKLSEDKAGLEKRADISKEEKEKLDAEISNLKIQAKAVKDAINLKNFSRNLNIKGAFVEARNYLISFYTKINEEIAKKAKENPNDVKIINLSNSTLLRFQAFATSFLEELKTDTTKNNIAKWYKKLLGDYEQILAQASNKEYLDLMGLGEKHQIIFNNVSYSEFANELIKWKINEFKKLKTLIEANENSVYDNVIEGQTGEKVKNGFIETINEIITQFEPKVNDKKINLLDQINLFFELNGLMVKYFYKDLGNDLYIYNEYLKLPNDENNQPFKTELIPWHLNNKVFESLAEFGDSTDPTQIIKSAKQIAEITKLKEQAKRVLATIRNTIINNADYIYSLPYRYLYEEIKDEILYILNFEYSEKTTSYLETLGHMSEIKDDKIEKWVQSPEKVEEEKTKYQEKIDQLKAESWDLISKKVSAKVRNEDPDSNFHPYSDLADELKERYKQANNMPTGSFENVFNKYVATKLANEYIKEMINLYSYWTTIGVDPKSDELENILKLKVVNKRIIKKLNNFKEQLKEKQGISDFYTTNIAPVLKREIPNEDSDQTTLLNFFKSMREGVLALKAKFLEAGQTEEYIQWDYEDNYQSFINKIEEYTNEGANPSLSDLKDLRQSLIDKITGRKETIDSELEAAQNKVTELEEQAKNATKDSFDERNYVIPPQELYAFIRQWNLENRAQLDKIKFDSNSAEDKALAKIFEQYSSLWSFGKEDTQTQPYINITNIDINDIAHVSDNNDFTPDKVKVKLLEIEKRYFQANEKLLNAIATNAENVEQLKTELAQIRNEYYNFLNDKTNYIFDSGYAKYKNGHYDNNVIRLNPLKLAKIYASERATFTVLKELDKFRPKDDELNDILNKLNNINGGQ